MRGGATPYYSQLAVFASLWALFYFCCFFLSSCEFGYQVSALTVLVDRKVISVLLLCSRSFTSFLSVAIPLLSSAPHLSATMPPSVDHLPNHIPFEFFSLMLVYLSFCVQ